VLIVTLEGMEIVMLSDSSPLKVTPAADAAVLLTVAVAPLMIVPNARGAVAVAEIGVSMVAELVTLVDCANAPVESAKKPKIAASAESLVFICVPVPFGNESFELVIRTGRYMKPHRLRRV
jgi:hypothetical protein